MELEWEVEAMIRKRLAIVGMLVLSLAGSASFVPGGSPVPVAALERATLDATVPDGGQLTGAAVSGQGAGAAFSVTVDAPDDGATPDEAGKSVGTSASARVQDQAASTVLLAAGDIARCGGPAAEATAKLLDVNPGTIVTLGDNAYPSGSAGDFANCYQPTWGRHRARTYPSPGNHDYGTTGAAGYFGYFGAAAGDPDRGYYSFDLGSWHIIALNSNCAQVGGCQFGSPQRQWLRADLAAASSTCTLAYWHQPRFSSGPHGDAVKMRPIWRMLHTWGADVVLGGHDHLYERFAPQNAEGQPDPVQGIRQFTVGTGGVGLYQFGTVKPNSEVRNDKTYGILKLTLYASSYDWEFIPTAGGTFKDTGHGQCH